MQEPLALRAIIATSAAATLLYTPVLKRLTLVKNVAVASVIALTPLTGALALGQVRTLAWPSGRPTEGSCSRGSKSCCRCREPAAHADMCHGIRQSG